MNLITVNEFCIHHNIERSFISSVQQTGLVNVTRVEEVEFIALQQLQQLEKIVHFYYDLGINLEGIETINRLLQRINNMQDEIVALKNRLRLYEANE